MKIVVSFVCGGVLSLALYLLVFDRPVTAPPLEVSQGLAHSYDQLVDSLAQAGDFVESHPWYGSEREQAEAYRHIMRTLVAAIEERFMHDPRFPYFRIINPNNKTGMDNPDQRYLIAILDGSHEYRIWGSRGTSRRLDFVLYEDVTEGRTLGVLSSDDLLVSGDGGFEVIVSPERQPGNWLRSEAVPGKLIVRQTFSDWASEAPGQVHIDRMNMAPGEVPHMNAAVMTQRLQALAAAFGEQVRHWPEFNRTVAGRFPENWLSPLRQVGDLGGLPGRLMALGHYNLEQDEALIITTWRSAAAYQGLQLGHHWWQSLDYADRQTSLTTDQARLSSDGAFHFVIAHHDPGVWNWLDTEGFQRAEMLLRYDGLHPPEIPDEQIPRVEKVPLTELFDHLPKDEPRVSPEQRAEQIAIRRQHVQRRYGN